MHIRSLVVTAPSKTILFGEHSVVYGQPALVSSLGRRLKLTINHTTSASSANEPSRVPCLLFPNLLNSNVSLSRGDVAEFLQTVNVNRDGSTYFEEVRQWLASRLDRSTAQSVRDACAAVLVIFTNDGRFPFHQLEVNVDSDVPVGAGLGSSAAFSVAAAASRLVLDGELAPNSDDWTTDDRERVSALAFVGEKLFHGSPSGLDNTIATVGGLLSYSRGAGTAVLPIRRKLRLLVVNTKVPRSTALMVKGVRERREADVEKYDRLFARIGDVVRRVQKLLTSDVEGDNLEVERQLDSLVKENQDLLREMGVSHSAIEETVGVIAKFGMSAKLTGAGGGGCVVAVVPSQFSEADVLMAEVRGRGYEAWLVSLGADGVAVESAKSS